VQKIGDFGVAIATTALLPSELKRSIESPIAWLKRADSLHPTLKQLP
jgi:hypothetical protein